MAAAIRVHGVVTGRVQGVNFRSSMRQQADRLGVGGWVRNRPDGRVEFEAEGNDAAVNALVAWAHTGPGAARVDRVDTHPVAPTSEQSFRIS
jgi:acylphosphatase